MPNFNSQSRPRRSYRPSLEQLESICIPATNAFTSPAALIGSFNPTADSGQQIFAEAGWTVIARPAGGQASLINGFNVLVRNRIPGNSLGQGTVGLGLAPVGFQGQQRNVYNELRIIRDNTELFGIRQRVRIPGDGRLLNLRVANIDLERNVLLPGTGQLPGGNPGAGFNQTIGNQQRSRLVIRGSASSPLGSGQRLTAPNIRIVFSLRQFPRGAGVNNQFGQNGNTFIQNNGSYRAIVSYSLFDNGQFVRNVVDRIVIRADNLVNPLDFGGRRS